MPVFLVAAHVHFSRRGTYNTGTWDVLGTILERTIPYCA